MYSIYFQIQATVHYVVIGLSSSSLPFVNKPASSVTSESN